MEYYVYQLIDPRDNSVFYVGKGCKRRMYRHVDEVQRGRSPNRSNRKLANKIKKILSNALIVKYKKIFITENEQKAYDKEIAVTSVHKALSAIGRKFSSGKTFISAIVRKTTAIVFKSVLVSSLFSILYPFELQVSHDLTFLLYESNVLFLF